MDFARAVLMTAFHWTYNQMHISPLAFPAAGRPKGVPEHLRAHLPPPGREQGHGRVHQDRHVSEM